MIGRTRWRFRSVDSTQNVAFQLAAQGAESGIVVRADYQSAGRGRLGRSWESPANIALMFSVMLRSDCAPHELGTLSILVANVLCDVFAEVGAKSISLKWPNDVLIDGRKVSGILLQTRMMPELVAVVGIGINVANDPESLPPTATSLYQAICADIDSDELLDRILARLDRTWSGWQSDLTANQREVIEQRLWLSGENVTLLDADREITGTIAGVASSGGLRLLVNGREQVVHVGEITRGPRPTFP